MPRIILIIDIPTENKTMLYSKFEEMVEDCSLHSFFSLVDNGESCSEELPEYMRHEKVMADMISILEENFIGEQKPVPQHDEEKHLSLAYQEDQAQAWHDHIYGSEDNEDFNDGFDSDFGEQGDDTDD